MNTRLTALAVAIALPSLIASPLALAQVNKPNSMDELVITASRIPLPLKQIGTSISVLTTADMQAHGNLSLSDILRQLPAISTSNNGGAGKVTSLRVRGEEGFRTLTIIDGIRLSDVSTPQIASQLEHQLSSGISRVEVLRGPQGLSYGADAGGVISMQTQQAEQGFNGNIDTQGGSFDTQQYAANLSGANDTLNYFVSATQLSTDGFNAQTADTVLQDNDGYDNTTLHGRLGIKLTDTLQAELVHRQADGSGEFDGCYLTTVEFNCTSDYALNASRAALNYQSSGFSHALSYSTTTTARDDYANNTNTFTVEGELNRTEYVGSATDLPGFDLVFGADLEQAHYDHKQRDNVGYFVEYLSDFSDVVHLSAGARYDDNDDFGSNTSYRLSAAYWLLLANDHAVKFKSSIGTGLRAPSPFEIAYNKGAYAYPPASLLTLLQEKSRGYEVGVEYVTPQALHLEAVYFDQQVEDAIYFDLGGFSGYLQDFGQSQSTGVELSAELPLTTQLTLRSNYTYNETERPNGLQRLRRPEQLFNVGLRWHGLQDKLNINGFYRSSANAVDDASGKTIPLDDFGVLDLSVSYNLSDKLQVYGRIENALDENYQEVIGYNTAGTAAYAGVRLNFSEL
jgi:vitamin B12 transporter